MNRPVFGKKTALKALREFVMNANFVVATVNMTIPTKSSFTKPKQLTGI